MLRVVALAALLSLGGIALAQETPAADNGQAPKRIRSVTLTGDQKCPPAADPDEIVVCAPLGEPFRIPKELRGTEPSAANQSWVTRVETMDEVGREAGGLPNTCSPVGSGGQTGCTQKLLREYNADRRAQDQAGSVVP